jgi:hypothetical protein
MLPPQVFLDKSRIVGVKFYLTRLRFKFTWLRVCVLKTGMILSEKVLIYLWISYETWIMHREVSQKELIVYS